jgi:antirestriction protein ArdC
MTKRKKKFDLYQTVTDQIIKAIETSQAKGVELPWHRAGASVFLPTNATTDKAYRGINILSLWASAEVNEFTTGEWATYKQWQSIGAQVRKGEKSTVGVFYKQIPPKETDDVDEESDDTENRPRWIARAFRVFNADQVDGYDPEDLPATSQVGRIERADAFTRRTGAKIQHGGGRAYYDRLEDRIQMPDEVRFKATETSTATEGYYSTLFHELTHWSGHEDRCARDLNNRFGDEAYAMEELVAELGAAFLCAELEISPQPREDHAGYIQHWMEVMKADKKAVFSAAARANEAAAYLTSR